jgi:hypothetical protein
VAETSRETVGADLRGAWFRECDLSGAHIRGSFLHDVEIDGDIEGLRVNGVEVAPLVEAELDRRHPERVALRAVTADERRAGWATLEAMWAPTMARVAAMPPGTVDVSVDGEWSFADTLRHLVCATDAWLGTSILGLPAAEAHHPMGLPYSQWEATPALAGLFDVAHRPPYDEVLQVRAERVAMVRDFLATVTDDQLDEPRPLPTFIPGDAPQTVGRCLRVLASEEWHHHRFAVRDLDAIEARSSHAEGEGG